MRKIDWGVGGIEIKIKDTNLDINFFIASGLDTLLYLNIKTIEFKRKLNNF